MLNIEKKCGKIDTNQRWLMCPACGRGRVLQLLPTTRAKDLIVYCKVCKRESIVNIPSVPVPCIAKCDSWCRHFLFVCLGENYLDAKTVLQISGMA